MNVNSRRVELSQGLEHANQLCKQSEIALDNGKSEILCDFALQAWVNRSGSKDQDKIRESEKELIEKTTLINR